jgi:hypothetical protein
MRESRPSPSVRAAPVMSARRGHSHTDDALGCEGWSGAELEYLVRDASMHALHVHTQTMFFYELIYLCRHATYPRDH